MPQDKINFYRHAAAVFDEARTSGSSSLQLPSSEVIKKKSVALILGALKCDFSDSDIPYTGSKSLDKAAIESIIARSRLLDLEKALFQKVAGEGRKYSAESLALVLVHDLLFAPKGLALPPEHYVRVGLERNVRRLKSEKEREKVRRGVAHDAKLANRRDARDHGLRIAEGAAEVQQEADEVAGNIRWMRVNALKWDMEQAEAWLAENGWRRKKSRKKVSTADKQVYARDADLPELLAFPISMLSLASFEPYLDGRLIAQDKASCIPARLLFGDGTQLPAHRYAVDATAAPGNKTSHLAALLHPSGGKVVAFERDGQRYETLKSLCEKAGCDNVETLHADFLAQSALSPHLRRATMVLVDPSCSGSGMPSRLNEEPADEARLEALARFQATILRFALNLPCAERVVYSTCSTHVIENEEVVCDVLGRSDVYGKWRVATRDEAMPSWNRRGLIEACNGDEDLAQGMIRCDARADNTHGFFVCLFVRITV